MMSALVGPATVIFLSVHISPLPSKYKDEPVACKPFTCCTFNFPLI